MRSEPAFAWSLKGLCYQNGGRRGEARTQSEPIGCASEKEHAIGADRLRERERARNRSRSAARARKSMQSEPNGCTIEKNYAIGAGKLLLLFHTKRLQAFLITKAVHMQK
ncbi:hypothetical protein PYW08_010285 [Mythimna loreyi]|uniref:Uncharacterized protein n=1 Tax=Mythimna loreyi TaxID=667449 RepID=A0ACC2Q4Y6_9NEOP|nr:hypothetical protein PYW08_010285 [Mythimna loreyi]